VELKRVFTESAGSNRVRLIGEVIHDDRPGEVEHYWFELPERYADSLSISGNPWLACLLPLAVTRGEPLRLCRPVDPVLRANVSRLMSIWSGWYPEAREVRIDAETEPTEPGPGAPEAAALFSGGVDSFFTLLRNDEERDREAFPAIDRLLCVWGFDIFLSTPQEFARLRSRLAQAAQDLGKEFVDVTTNLRDSRFREAPWGPIGHGCALASVGLTLERRFRAVYISATHSSGSLIPWGSHPETDPLLSTSITRIIHYGVDFGRSEKTWYIARSDVAMRSLHVCFRFALGDNCCACRKCYLTMLTLDVAGALSRCPAFRVHDIDLGRVRRIFVDTSITAVIFREIESRARAQGRHDVADAIQDCLSRSRRRQSLMSILGWLSRKRGLWRIARRLRPLVLAGSVR
jgi:hypothetical protein